jgi:chemotaxis protein methyltransferase CheR
MNLRLMQVSDQEFIKFQQLIERETGIFLGPAKKDLLVGRLSKRLRSLKLDSFAAYWAYVMSGRDPEERVRMLDCICTNETHFFREPAHFSFLQKEACSKLASGAAKGLRPRRIRVWSAGCSTGEEPYSIAMALLNRFPPGSGWQLSVLASDLSTRALTQARQACYSEERASELPAAMARLFVKRERSTRLQPHTSGVTLAPLLKELVEFKKLNLTLPAPADLGRFDLVFCRNVMIYFQPATRKRVVEMLLAHLAPDGYLFLGHAESLIHMRDRVRCVGPTIYVPADDEKNRTLRAT